jgi:hypothetical protein
MYRRRWSLAELKIKLRLFRDSFPIYQLDMQAPAGPASSSYALAQTNAVLTRVITRCDYSDTMDSLARTGQPRQLFR